MKIVIFGLGSIGLRHARLLQETKQHEVYAFRSGKDRPGNPLGLEEISSWQEADKIKPEAALITNPTFLHIKTALPCAERGMAIFMEKPIDSSTEELEGLLALVRKNNLASYVAYVLRFHPAVRELKEELKGKKILKARFVSRSWLPEWRPGQNHRESYSARREMGGGALLDVSHEFDLAEYLFGTVQDISGHLEKRSDVTRDAEDFVEATLHCPSIKVEIVLDIASHDTERRMTIETDQETFTKNLQGQGTDRDLPYREQLRYFLDNIENSRMMNNLAEATPLFKKLVTFRNEQFSKYLDEKTGQKRRSDEK